MEARATAGSRGGGSLQQGRRAVRRLAGLALAGIAGAAAAAGDPPAAPPPAVPLDRLFKLPDSVAAPVGEERRGGKTRAEWQERFQSAAAELAKARQALADSRKKLEEIAPDKGWSMSAPGMPVNTSETPLDFKLRQEMRREREDVEHAERHLDELTVEANLASVPEDWRRAAAPPEGAPRGPAAPSEPSAPPEPPTGRASD
jgi:hypothetical protein